MGVQWPRSSRAHLRPSGGRVEPRTIPASWTWVGVLALILVTAALLLADSVRGFTVSGLPWIVAPLLAAVGWAYASRRAEARAHAAFRTFQVAAVLGAVAHVAGSFQATGAAPGAVPASGYLLLGPPLAIMVGIAFALGSRRPSVWTPRLAADTTLLLLAVVAAALRLVVEPALRAGAVIAPEQTVVVLQVVTILPVLLAAQVVLRRGTALSPWAGSLLFAATLTFAVGGFLPLSEASGGRYAFGHSGTYVDLAGWLLFAVAGYSARAVPATANAMLAGRRAPDAVRKLLVPGTALFLAVAVVDIGLGQPARTETVLAVALLGVVLALRTGQAFNLVDRDADQRRQIAHTRALVDVTHALAGTTELDETLRVISESARGVFGTRGAGIELLTDDGNGLETRSAVGLPEEVLGLRFPLQGSFTGWVVRHQEPRATTDPSRDPYIQPQSLSFLGKWPVAAAPIQFQGETQGALFACIRSEPFDAEELELLGAMAEQAAIAIQQARLFEQVTIMSVTDPLTGLANRRQLERDLPREFAAALRGRDLTAVIFDLDSFKHYNDDFGHLAGDKALQAFGAALKKETRAMNLAARYGGDEFVAVLAGTDAAGARSFIRRVRERFRQAVEALGHGPVTVSAGLAQCSPEMKEPEELLRAADDELYRAKPQTRVMAQSDSSSRP